MTHGDRPSPVATILYVAALVTAALGVTGCSQRNAGDGEHPGSEEQHPAAGQREANEHATENRVTLSEAADRTAAIVVEEVRHEPRAGATDGMQVPGQVEFDPTRVALISPRTSGRIERVAVVDGDRVAAGAPVAFLLSPAFLTGQAEFVRAVQRAERLTGTPDADGAQALAVAARRRLRLLGAADREIVRLEAGGEPADFLAVTAPFAGSIIEVRGLPGASVEAGTPIATIADLSVVTVVFDLPERAMATVRLGQRATVRVAALPGTELDGRIERIRDELDPATRTVKGLIRVPNPERRLKAGMFATVTLATGEAAAGVLSVPTSAVVTDGDARYVFVEVAPRTYERREVSVAPPTYAGLPRPALRVVVRDGLVAGERVVTHGAFTLQSELAKSSFGAEHD